VCCCCRRWTNDDQVLEDNDTRPRSPNPAANRLVESRRTHRRLTADTGGDPNHLQLPDTKATSVRFSASGSDVIMCTDVDGQAVWRHSRISRDVQSGPKKWPPKDYNSERIFKIGQYLAKLCVEHFGFTFLDQPCIYRVVQKIWHHFLLCTLTLPNTNRFSKLFHCQNQEKICNNTVAEDPTTPHVCCCCVACEMSVS